MSTEDIIRAWKDPEYRAEWINFAPEHPAGRMELTDPGLEDNPAELPLRFDLRTHAHWCV